MKSSAIFRALLALLASLLVPAPIVAAEDGGAPPGAHVRALAINPASPNTVYAGTLGGGVFKSTNGGATWTASNSGLTNLFINKIVVDPTTPSTVYAGTSGSGVFKSTDGGSNWTASNLGLTSMDVHVIAVDPTSLSTVYAGGFGVFKSTNGGTSWSVQNTGLVSTNIAALVVDPATPTTLYAGVVGILGTPPAFGGGVYKSVDGGASWTLTGFTGQEISTLAIDPAHLSTLYVGSFSVGVPFSPFFRAGGLSKSTDGGITWSNASAGLPISLAMGTSVNTLAVDPITSTTLYAGTSRGVFKSTDGAANWIVANTGLPAFSVPSLAVNPMTPTTLYAGTAGDGVYKSTDGGATWQPTGQGEEPGLIEKQENPLLTINICAVDRTGRVHVGGRVGVDATIGELVFVSRGNRNQSVAAVLGDGSFEGVTAPGFAQAGQRVTVAVRFPAGKIALLSTCRLGSSVGNRR